MPETTDGGFLIDDRDAHLGPYGRKSEGPFIDLSQKVEPPAKAKKPAPKPWPNVKRRD